MFNTSRLAVLTTALLCSTLLALSQDLPDGKGKEAVVANCNSCQIIDWLIADFSVFGLRINIGCRHFFFCSR